MCRFGAPATDKSTATACKIKEPKPQKPYPEFPLFPHATRRWAKKIRGKMHYFGPWADPDASLAKYLDQKDSLHRGLTPTDTNDNLTVLILSGKFLTTKKRMLEAGELSPRSFAEYTGVCKGLVKTLSKNRLLADLRQDDFEKIRAKLASKWGPVRLGNEINRVRTVLRYAYTSGLISRPMIYGEGFRRPSKKVLRTHRHQQSRAW